MPSARLAGLKIKLLLKVEVDPRFTNMGGLSSAFGSRLDTAGHRRHLWIDKAY